MAFLDALDEAPGAPGGRRRTRAGAFTVESSDRMRRTRRSLMPDPPLLNQVAVVAGATRGAGRGIARMLGAAGATVYCTGRSVRGAPGHRRAARDDRGDGRDGDRGRGPRHRRADRPHRRGRGRAALRPRPRRAGPPRRARQRRLGRRCADRVGQAVLGALHRAGARAAGARGPQPHRHEPARRAADGRAQRRARRRGHRRRHARLSRQPLLRPGEERGHPARVRDGRRPARAPGDGPGSNAGHAAVRGGARPPAG